MARRPELSVSIMAHRSRGRFVAQLRRRLPGVPVAWDKYGDRWETGTRALLLHDPKAKWHLCLQDDAIICRDLLVAAERAARAAGERPVSLYTGAPRPKKRIVAPAVLRAQAQGSPWIEMPGPWWGVAIILPTAHIEPLVEWGNLHPELPNYDGRIAAWYASVVKVRCWYSVPSLVDHRPVAVSPSLIAGRTGNRRAYEFIGTRRSAAGIDWEREPVRGVMRRNR
jgi:hypothetical protein